MHVLPLPLDKGFDLLDNFLMHFFILPIKLTNAGRGQGGVQLSWQVVLVKYFDICQCQLHLQGS